VDGEAVEGVTDASGLVDQPVTAGNTRGELLLWPDDDPDATCRFKLALGELDPADELTGAQARLANLGFMEPGMTREDGEVTRAALRWFQRAHGLAETGTLDAATSDKLQQIHDE
jgi:peptidoglycan hydrolase-like protein with peptidoglycan-binding domain